MTLLDGTLDVIRSLSATVALVAAGAAAPPLESRSAAAAPELPWSGRVGEAELRRGGH